MILKDENEFEIKLTDYGLAKSYQNNTNSKYYSFVGTEYYIAPEVFQNNGCSKSDLWSVGAMMYQLHFKAIPYPGFSEQQILKRIENNYPRNPNYNFNNLKGKNKNDKNIMRKIFDDYLYLYS